MKSTCRLILGGTGGQGVLTLGRLVAGAAMIEKLNVTCYPVYGAEMRGGYTFSSLTISRNEIASPIIDRAAAGVFLAQFAFDYLRTLVEPGGTLVFNADLVTVDGARRRRLFPLRATEYARRLGDERCANMVAAGFLARQAGRGPDQLAPFPALPSLRKALSRVFAGRPALLEMNRRALDAGYAAPVEP